MSSRMQPFLFQQKHCHGKAADAWRCLRSSITQVPMRTSVGRHVIDDTVPLHVSVHTIGWPTCVTNVEGVGSTFGLSLLQQRHIPLVSFPRLEHNSTRDAHSFEKPRSSPNPRSSPPPQIWHHVAVQACHEVSSEPLSIEATPKSPPSQCLMTKH